VAPRFVAMLIFCNMAPLSFRGAIQAHHGRIAMAVVGVVWLGTVALWLLKEFDNHD